MSNIFDAVKVKFKNLKSLRVILIALLVLILLTSVALAWYINNVDIWGMEFQTGNIAFETYVYDDSGNLVVGPVSSEDDGVANTVEAPSKYMNAPLITIKNGEAGTMATGYIAVKSTGSIGIQYRIAFGIEGRTPRSHAFLGGYKYLVTNVSSKVNFSGSNYMDITGCTLPNGTEIKDEVVTIDKNPVNGNIEQLDGWDVYRVDFYLKEHNEEYTDGGINIYFNISATQIDGNFENLATGGTTYWCSTREDIDDVKVKAFPGDIIKLTNNITYYGDLVFNKPVHLETNNYTLTVRGNLMYDYVLENDLKIDVGGMGQIVVECTNEGVGGNLLIKAPLSNVTLVGSNASLGDMVVEKSVIIDATNSYGAVGVSFNEVRIVNDQNARKTIQLESNTRATVSFGTTLGIVQAVAKANNIEIVNNGDIGQINLSGMEQLKDANGNVRNDIVQIYIVNNKSISEPILLPKWSVKWVEETSTGNTRIVESISGSRTEIDEDCECVFDSNDIERETRDAMVEQIESGNDSRLRIYYQDTAEKITSIQSILEEYLKVSAGCAVHEVVQLEIICVGDKAITNDDIAFMNSDSMLSLKQLDMQKANMYDETTDTADKLPASAYYGITKYEELVLPRNLVEIGAKAFATSGIDNIITIPSGVTTFGAGWFENAKYVHFAASVPLTAAADGTGLTNVNAIFVEEAYIDSYRTVYSKYATRIYPVSVMDETKHHFVRNTKGDEWEITYFIGGDDKIIGENITMSGTILNITGVYDYAYRHNFTGTSVQFASSVKTLGVGNFQDNSNITSADLNHLIDVGSEAFANATRLANINFGSTLETIGAKAFYNCVGITQEVSLPNSMQKIGASAFEKTKITSVNTGGTKSIDGSAFAYCQNLLSAVLPEVKNVGEDGTNLLFQQCSKLVSVKMPSLVKANGSLMFTDCTSLREIYLATNDEGITLGDNPFYHCTMAKIKLFVPEEYIDFFRAKQPGGISSTRIYPEGEIMGTELINGFNIGTYVVMDNGDNTYTLITSNISHTDTLSIPETFNEKPITKIYDDAFRNQSFTNVTVTLGNNIESIGSYAFYRLSGLVKVEFGDSLKTIDEFAFANCSNLVQKLELPASMESIGREAFRYTGILTLNTGGTTSVETRAFANCTSLASVIMPEVSVVAASGTNELFIYCSYLVSVDMPKLTKVYGADMFRSCQSLREVYLHTNDDGISLGSFAFSGIDTTKLKLFVPEELLSFYQEKNLIVSSRLYPIGEKVGTNSLNEVLLGDYIVLKNDTGYTLVTATRDFTGEVPLPTEHNGEPITEIYPNALRNQSFTDATIILGDNVKVIGHHAFYGATGLVNIVMDGVTTIQEQAFYGSGLQSLNAPKLKTIGEQAFRQCGQLEVISVPRLQTIESIYVFADCTNLKSVYFEDIMSLNKYTFAADLRLEKITINRQINANGDNMPAVMTISEEAPCTIYVPYRSLSAYPAIWSGKPVASFDISATSNGNTYILSENNGRYTLIDFVPSQAVTALALPSTVSASELGNISIYAIGQNAFSTVSDTLKTLTLSSSIALLSGNALSECSVLEKIYVNADNANFTSVNGVLYSKDKKMLVKYPCGKSGSFDMTASDYDATIGIGANAFTNATKMTQIVFPSSLLAIDSTAFNGCKQLNTVEFTGNTPPILMGSGIFDTSVEDFKMVIPTATSDVITTYLYAYGFGEYEPYIELPSTYEKPAMSIDMTIRIPSIAVGNVHGGNFGQKIATFAQTYLGCPYVYGGSSPSGFDCSGFVQYVYMQNGILLNRTATDQLENGYCVAYDEMQAGDLVFFGSGDIATHVGIYIGDGKFVHAQNTATGVVISSLSEAYYAGRFLCAHRIVD